MLNRQYDNAVKELLGVTAVDNELPSKGLSSDFSGAMTSDAWRLYQQVGAKIAAQVMSGPNKSKFITCAPSEASCLENTIKTFGRKAFRRPLTDAEVARFKKLGETTPKGTPDEVAQTTLEAFLVSPSFLPVPELTTEAEGTAIKLSPHEVAARLSFLLWDSVPDEELNAVADAGMLQTKEQILTQAQRMIAERSKTGPFISAFHRDWAQMNNGSGHWWKIDHDKTKFPLYDAAKKPSWEAEMDAFFEEVAFSNGSFNDLLLSNVGFVNKDNAELYGLNPANFGAELMKTTLTDRPGFLTRVGFLSSYSNYDASSPILRGAFIVTYLLGVNPGAPIPGAAMQTVEGNFTTQRAYTEALTDKPACTGCHTVINPSGFVLEKYDSLGKVQEKDPRGGAIDASVTTATVDFGGGNQKSISTPLQLMQEIAQMPKAKELYAQAWVSYAFGRERNANDQCIVDQLNQKLTQGNYSILSLLADLTQADSFRLRVRETP